MTERIDVEKTKHEKKNRIQLWIILLLLLLLGVGAGMFYFTIQSSQKGRLARDELALGGMLPGKTQEEIGELLNAKVEEGMVDIGIAAEPIFEQNGKKGRIGIENIAGNHYSFQVSVRLDDTGEVIYESGLIDPGYYVEFIELNQKMQAGDYEATAIFSTYSLDETEDKIAQTNVKIILHVMDGVFYK